MKKLLFLICLLYSGLMSKAQQFQLFKIKYLPDHSYKTNIKMDMNMEMGISGDSAKMAQFKAQGIKLPMILDGTTDMNLSVKTGRLAAENKFPLLFKYTDITAKQSVNGEEMPKKDNPLVGQSIYASCTKDGQIHVDSISGKTMNDQLKATITTMIDNLSELVKFPEKPLNIGEAFTQDVPLSIPMAGLNLKFDVKIIYKLTKVQDNLAFFDLDESMTLDMSGEKDAIKLNASGSGSGGGKLVYNIKENFADTMNSTLAFKLDMFVQDMKMNCTAKITSVNQTQISSDKN